MISISVTPTAAEVDTNVSRLKAKRDKLDFIAEEYFFAFPVHFVSYTTMLNRKISYES